jgi:hypothetical protein
MAFLVGAVVGSGIMAAKLAGGNGARRTVVLDATCDDSNARLIIELKCYSSTTSTEPPARRLS